MDEIARAGRRDPAHASTVTLPHGDAASPPEGPRLVDALLERRPTHHRRELSRIRALTAVLGDPQRAYPAVAVTGTNGKTSVARMIAAILSAHDVSTGAFTSPHVEHVRERIAVDGSPIDPDAFTTTLRSLWPYAERVEAAHGHMVTFFEALTALACVHFAHTGVGAGVFEVGKGGRVDPTRVVDADVAVLTPVALDHPELGATPAAVAVEKAGIIADGATVVSAAQEPEVATVIDRAARRRRARLLLAGHDFGVGARTPRPGGQRLDLHAVTVDVPDVWVPLAGEHQVANAACALAAAEALLGGRVDPAAVREGFAAVRVPGRLERIDRTGHPPVLLDGAHNPAAARALAASLRTDHPGRSRVLVLGACADKDVAGIVAALAPVTDRFVTTTAPGPRAAVAADLAALARDHGCRVDAVPDVAAALARATELTVADDLVVVAGSLYTVAAVRDLLMGAASPRP